MTTMGAAVDETLRQALLPELELIRPLGSGATAEVLLAREPALQRLVAVKVLRAAVAEDTVARRRFEREAQAAARIVHPNVTSIFRVGRTPAGQPFIVMEYVDGRVLGDLLPPAVTYDEPTARALLAAIAAALAAAHAHGIIHRDVRPGNVLIENRTGRAVLGDFGIAALLESGSTAITRLTAAGVMVGDARYLSPEQVRGESAVELSDVYAFGILAFELLTGSGPYRARKPAELLTAHLQQQPADLHELRPDIGERLASLINRCLAKEATRRPLASELAAQLAPAPATRAVQEGAVAGSLALLLGELRRRRVYQVAAAYTAAALGVLAVAQVVYDAFELSRPAGLWSPPRWPAARAGARWPRHPRGPSTEPAESAAGARCCLGGLAGSLPRAALAGWLLLR
jgi:serine/threonine-protein kinase